MADPASPPRLIRFDGLEVDLRAGELRKKGEKIKLQEQPLQILTMLLERPGDTVTREEIRKKLWPDDTIVEFDHSINAAIQRLRQELGDSADHPRFVETMARRGYRFVAAVEVGAIHESPLRKWRAAVAAASAIIAIVAALLALNVAGLRDRVLGTAAPKIESIAVLPLKNLSGEPEQEYFADGMTDALITELGKVSALRIISAQSMLQYRGTEKPVPQIARELNVHALIEGSVLRSGDRVRINAQLVRAQPEAHLWSDSFERDLRDVLELQSQVARAIAREVKVNLTPDERVRLAASRPIHPEAHEAYLRGRYFFRRWPEGLEKAIEHFQQAILKDPDYAPAHAHLAVCYSSLAFFQPPMEAFAKARMAATKALELDETLALAHAALGSIQGKCDWDWAGAEREFKRAIELNPNSADVHIGNGFFLTAMGRFDEAIAARRRAVELDPVSPLAYNEVGWALTKARRFDESIAAHKEALELDPNFTAARVYLAWAYTFKGMYTETEEEIEKLNWATDSPFAAFLLAVSGREREALEMVERLEKGWAKEEHVDSTWAAIPYAGLGDAERACAWLNRAYDERDAEIVLLKVDPWFDRVRDAPCFQDLLRRMNFPE